MEMDYFKLDTKKLLSCTDVLCYHLYGKDKDQSAVVKDT